MKCIGQSEPPSMNEIDVRENNFDIQGEDEELKVHRLRKYSGYLGSLKKEFLSKKKNGKLPKKARQQLLDWWNCHYKWPNPSLLPRLHNFPGSATAWSSYKIRGI